MNGQFVMSIGASLMASAHYVKQPDEFWWVMWMFAACILAGIGEAARRSAR